MDDEHVIKTPGVNLLYAQLANRYGEVDRDALADLVNLTAHGNYGDAQLEVIVLELLYKLGGHANESGVITLPDLDLAFQNEDMQEQWANLFGHPGELLFQEHLYILNESLPGNEERHALDKEYLGRVLESKGIANGIEHADMLLNLATDKAVGITSEDFLKAFEQEAEILCGILYLEAEFVPPASFSKDSIIIDPEHAFRNSLPSFDEMLSQHKTEGPGFGIVDRQLTEIQEQEDFNSALSPDELSRSSMETPLAERDGDVHSPDKSKQDERQAAAHKKVAQHMMSKMLRRNSGTQSPVPEQQTGFAEFDHSDDAVTDALERRQKNIKMLFDTADDDESGAIDADELFHVLHDPSIQELTLGDTISKAPKCYFEFLFELLDSDGNGTLDYDEFHDAFLELLDENNNFMVPDGLAGAQVSAWQKSFDVINDKYDNLSEDMDTAVKQFNHDMAEKDKNLDEQIHAHEEAHNAWIQAETLYKAECLAHKKTKDAYYLLESQQKSTEDDLDGLVKKIQKDEENHIDEHLHTQIRHCEARIEELKKDNGKLVAEIEDRDNTIATYKRDYDTLLASQQVRMMPSDEPLDIPPSPVINTAALDQLDVMAEELADALHLVRQSVHTAARQLDDVSRGDIPEDLRDRRSDGCIARLSTSTISRHQYQDTHVDKQLLNEMVFRAIVLLNRAVEAENEADDLQKQLEDLQSKFASKDDHINTLSGENTTHLNNLEEHSNEIAELHGKLAESHEVLVGLQATADELERENAELKGQLDGSLAEEHEQASELESTRARIAEMEADVRESQSMLNVQMKKISDLEDKLEKAQQHLRESEISLAKSDELQHGLVQANTELQQEAEQARKLATEAVRAKATAEQELEDAHNKLKSQQAKYAALLAAHNVSEKDWEAERNQLNEALLTAKDGLGTTEKETMDLRANINDQQNEINKLRKSLSDTEASLKSANHEICANKEELSTLRQQLQAAQDQIKEERKSAEEQCSRLKKSHDEAIDELTTKHVTEIEALKSANEADSQKLRNLLEEQNKQHRGQMDALQKQHADECNSIISKRDSTLQQSQQTAQQLAAAAEKRATDALANAERLQQEINEMRAASEKSAKDADTTAEQLQREVSRLADENAMLSAECKTRDDELATSKLECISAKEALERVKTEMETIMDDLKRSRDTAVSDLKLKSVAVDQALKNAKKTLGILDQAASDAHSVAAAIASFRQDCSDLIDKSIAEGRPDAVSQAASLSDEAAAIEIQLNGDAAEVQKLVVSLQTASSEAAALSALLPKLVARHAELSDAASKNEELMRECKRLEEELHSGRNRYDTVASAGVAARDALKLAEEKVKKLQDEVATLKAELDGVQCSEGEASKVAAQYQAQLRESALGLANVEASLASANDLIQDLNADLNRSKQACERAQNEIHLARQNANVSLAEVARVNAVLAEAQQQVQAYEQRLHDAMNDADLNEIKLREANLRIDDLVRQAIISKPRGGTETATALAASNHELSKVKRALEQLQAADSRRKDAFSAQSEMLKTQNAEMERAWMEQQALCADALQKVHQLEIQLARKEQEASDLKNKLSQAEQNYGVLTQKLGVIRNAQPSAAMGANDEMKMLKSKNDDLEATCSVLEGQIKLKDGQLQTLRVKLTSAEDDVERLKTQVIKLKDAVLEKESELETLHEQQLALTSDVSSSDLNRAQLEREVTSLKSDFESALAETANCKRKLRQVETEFDLNNKRIDSLEKDLANANHDKNRLFGQYHDLIDKSSASIAQAELASSLQEEVQRLRRNGAGGMTNDPDLASVRMKLIEAEAQAKQLDDELERTTSNMAKIQRELNAKTVALDALSGRSPSEAEKRALLDAESERDSLSKRLDTAQGQYKTLVQRVQDDMVKSAELSSKLQIEKSVTQKLRDDLHRANCEKETANIRAEATTEEVNNLQNELTKVHQENSVLRARVDELEQKLRAAMMQLEKVDYALKSEAGKKSELADMSATLERMQAQLDAAQNNHSEYSLATRLAQQEALASDARVELERVKASAAAEVDLLQQQCDNSKKERDREASVAADLLASRDARFKSEYDMALDDIKKLQAVLEESEELVAKLTKEGDVLKKKLSKSIKALKKNQVADASTIDAEFGVHDDEDENDNNKRLKVVSGTLLAEVIRLRRDLKQLEEERERLWNLIRSLQQPKLVQAPSTNNDKDSENIVKINPKMYYFSNMVVLDSKLARRLDLPEAVTIGVSQLKFDLISPGSASPVFSIPLNHIKKYGQEGRVCSVELGHISKHHGVLHFDTFQQSNRLFSVLTMLMAT